MYILIKWKINKITFEFGICYFNETVQCVFSILATIYCNRFCDNNMEWGGKGNRNAVIALHLVGMVPNTKFYNMLDISEMFVYRANW